MRGGLKKGHSERKKSDLLVPLLDRKKRGDKGDDAGKMDSKGQRGGTGKGGAKQPLWLQGLPVG